MTAYYNEIDPHAAQWLRELIAAGHIAPGDVDERSIVDVRPDDLRGYVQCHFFAGIGGWSHALRLAGIPDSRPLWTGSCPCQPFSAAGKQRGSEDERHLWPAFFDLIRECRPRTVIGEQVAGSAGYAWWDHVAADLEGAGYAAAAANLGAHSVGSPHIRQRIYWVAHSTRHGRHEWRTESAGQQGRFDAAECCGDGGMADAEHSERWTVDVHREDGRDGEDCGREETHGIARACGEVRVMADADEFRRKNGSAKRRRNGERDDAGICHVQFAEDGEVRGMADASVRGPLGTIDRRQCGTRVREEQSSRDSGSVRACGEVHGMADAGQGGRIECCANDDSSKQMGQRPQASERAHADGRGEVCGVGDSRREGSQGLIGPCDVELHGDSGQVRPVAEAGLSGQWSDIIWLPCSDGKSRPAKPGIQPLVTGLPGGVVRGGDPGAPIDANATTEARVMRLRGYGNAIVPQVAAAFLTAAIT